MRRAVLACAVLAGLGSGAAAQPGPEAVARYGAADAAHPILIQGALDIPAFAPALEAFVASHPAVAVTLEQWNTNDLFAAMTVACAGAAPVPDLVISSAVDQQVKLVNDACAQPYRSAGTAALPPERNWRDELFGLTSEPAVMVYNRALLPPGDAPASRFDLLDLLRREDGVYAGRIATYDIERSGIGYLFAFLDSIQATTFGGLIEAFGRARVVATCCSAEIVDAVARGEYLVAYNILGPYAMVRAATNPDLAVVTPSDYTLVLSRGAFIPKGARDPGAAGAFVDFLLSEPGRRALAETYLTPGPGNPPEDAQFTRPIPLSPVLLVGLDRQKRARLLALWRETFPETR
ncbi:ABC transporter substrate-binding protein [Amaricoccus solimangrovi]|uniref:ABC transporter substrate-binding protein n=1 Tax=Amaricoccus solimangrovi TaxID=2589815 RepID=A0A501WVX8_9RHOB|nr:ABC transporter substrate-binding protein [Amaricoccus solimangrovi]TPE52455.1 ABC transporter substrate-binding protein [Amaricoccus solimangrovi]